MTAARTLLAALSEEPTSTSDLYEHVGYPTLVRIGLVPYEAFRAELVRLAEAGLAQSGVDDDGATTWRLRTPAAGEAGAEP